MLRIYSDFEALDAPHGTTRFPNTDVQVVAKRVFNTHDLVITITKNGKETFSHTFPGLLLVEYPKRKRAV